MIDLNDDELIILDGKCTPATQVYVDAAKERLELSRNKDNPELWRFIADVKIKAREEGRLEFRYTRSRWTCPVCGNGGGYHTYPRNSRWHRKGEKNFDNPISKAFVSLGCCRLCWEEYSTIIGAELDDIEAEIPELITGHSPRFKSYEKYKCTQCGWRGHEGEMRKLPALMGGYYAGGCPDCQAENLPFGTRVVELLHERVVVAVGS